MSFAGFGLDYRTIQEIPSGIPIPKWEIFTHGGRNKTEIDAIEFAKKMIEVQARYC